MRKNEHEARVSLELRGGKVPSRDLEVFYGLDPLRWDVDNDDDKDTIPNGRELEWHLNPRVQQQPEDTRDRYRYDRPEVARTIDGRSCYEFEVRRIKLAFTSDSEVLPAALDGVGFNEIRLYLLENMADNLSGEPLVRTACVRGHYIPPAKKIPVGGEVILTEADFGYLNSSEFVPPNPVDYFDPRVDCIDAE